MTCGGGADRTLEVTAPSIAYNELKDPPVCGGTQSRRISFIRKWAGFGCRLARTLNELFDGCGFVERLSCVGQREGRAYDAVIDGSGDRQ